MQLLQMVETKHHNNIIPITVYSVTRLQRFSVRSAVEYYQYDYTNS